MKAGPFFQCAGASGRSYERLRLAALSRADTGAFQRWGMTLLVPHYCTAGGHLWTVKRVRASMRAGELMVKELLNEMGVLSGLSGSPAVAKWKEVLL